MKWARKLLLRTSGWFNQEPLTPLDETLRFPVALKEIYRLVYKEYGIPIVNGVKIHKGFVYFRSLSYYILRLISSPRFFLKVPGLMFKLKRAKVSFESSTKQYLRELEEIKRSDLRHASDKEIYNYLTRTIQFDAHWIFMIGGGPHTLLHYLSESLLKFLYRRLVKDPNPTNYSQLLIGYSNKLLEADMAFWGVVRGKLPKREFLSKYGYRATEATLLKATIGEDTGDFERKIQIFRKLTAPNFEEVLRKAAERRRNREKFVKETFKWGHPLGGFAFRTVLALARKYITVREDRRFYYTLGTYPIRRACLELGSRFSFLYKPSDIFFMTKEEVENAVNNIVGMNTEEIKEAVSSRKAQWQRWHSHKPPLTIEA